MFRGTGEAGPGAGRVNFHPPHRIGPMRLKLLYSKNLYRAWVGLHRFLVGKFERGWNTRGVGKVVQPQAGKARSAECLSLPHRFPLTPTYTAPP